MRVGGRHGSWPLHTLSVPTAGAASSFVSPLPLHQVARLFHFVSSVDNREGQVTLWRGVTNPKLTQSWLRPSCPLRPWSGSVAVASHPVCAVLVNHGGLPPRVCGACEPEVLRCLVLCP